MKIHIHNRWLAASIISLTWFCSMFITVARAALLYNTPPYIELFVLSFFSTLVTFGVLRAYHATNTNQAVRRKRIEKLLRQLEDEDLDFLRERLSPQESEEDEYDALEASLNRQKRKNR